MCDLCIEPVVTELRVAPEPFECLACEGIIRSGQLYRHIEVEEEARRWTFRIHERCENGHRAPVETFNA